MHQQLNKEVDKKKKELKKTNSKEQHKDSSHKRFELHEFRNELLDKREKYFNLLQKREINEKNDKPIEVASNSGSVTVSLSVEKQTISRSGSRNKIIAAKTFVSNEGGSSFTNRTAEAARAK